MLGVFVDVSERHRAEQERRDLGGRLINAHEDERRRLSRELHDGVGQRLALLSVELTRLREEATSVPPILDHVRKLSEHIEEVGSELHRLSHELHPAWLEQLGLAASLRRICGELADAGGLTIHLEIDDIPSVLTSDVALAVYRIAQEALHNIVKHSAAANATVQLHADGNDIVLNVIDDGRGFEPLAEACHERGRAGQHAGARRPGRRTDDADIGAEAGDADRGPCAARRSDAPLIAREAWRSLDSRQPQPSG